MSDAPLATSVPVYPMEKPTSAKANAGASFVPSPVTATTSSEACSPFTKRYLSVGEHLEMTLNCRLIFLNICILPIISCDS